MLFCVTLTAVVYIRTTYKDLCGFCAWTVAGKLLLRSHYSGAGARSFSTFVRCVDSNILALPIECLDKSVHVQAAGDWC